MRYPLKECLESLLGFCEEVVVVDAGSTDGTIGFMREFSDREPRVRFFVEPVDFSHPRWAIRMDGLLKAKARARCAGDYCWQTDTDEVVAPHDYGRIRQLPEVLQEFFADTPVIFLPMVEFWGSFEIARADFFSWKPRFSKNMPNITHGIPAEYSMRDADGYEYCRPFDTDSCNYIWSDSKQSVKMLIPKKVNNYDMSLEEFEAFFNESLDDLPSVQHVSWFDLRRKIEHYREFWPKFHASMYNLADPDTAERNVMFNKPWADVTDEDIVQKAEELERLGPRSFHHKLNPSERGRTIPFTRPVADSLRNWAPRGLSLGGDTKFLHGA
jgi:glycosyltransferase involved in cell wall biosynthesis